MHMQEGLGENRFLLLLVKQEQTLASWPHFALPQKMRPMGLERPSVGHIKGPCGILARTLSRKVPKFPYFPSHVTSVALGTTFKLPSS